MAHTQILARYSPDVARNEIEDLTCFGIRDGHVLIKCVGAYCGEVIRRTQSNKWRWRTYAGFLMDPNFADEVQAAGMPSSHPVIDLVLTGSKVRIRAFPSEKVAKFTVNGPEDSLYSYAAFVMQAISKPYDFVPQSLR